MEFSDIHTILDAFIVLVEEIDKCNNKSATRKKIRRPNFPSEISENIVRLFIEKSKQETYVWDKKGGDLFYDKLKIEVKAFSSSGPTSFGPSENWDLLYFVDCMDYRNKNFKIYVVNCSNKSDVFRNIKLNKVETFGEIADKNQRGKLRGGFETIFKKQLGNKCELIFSGNLQEFI
jgi:hypothetical protein